MEASDKKLYLYSALSIGLALAVYFVVAKKPFSTTNSGETEGDLAPDVVTGTGDVITNEQATISEELSALLKKSSPEVTAQLLNKSLYTKLDNVKIRYHNFVNNGWWKNNLMATVPTKGTFLGNVMKVVDDKNGAKNPEGRVYKWFYVFPSQPVKDLNTDVMKFYVREDVIKLQK